MSKEEIRQITYLGDGDVAVWLAEANGTDPLIYPLWPRDYPEHVAVYIAAEGELAVAFSRRAALVACAPQRLWFCHISMGDLVAFTDAEASWFKGG